MPKKWNRTYTKLTGLRLGQADEWLTDLKQVDKIKLSKSAEYRLRKVSPTPLLDLLDADQKDS